MISTAKSVFSDQEYARSNQYLKQLEALELAMGFLKDEELDSCVEEYTTLVIRYGGRTERSWQLSNALALQEGSDILINDGLNLENGTPQAQAIDTLCTEGESYMAKRIKQRVKLSNETRWVTGTTNQEILEAAARLLFQDGAIEIPQAKAQKSPLFSEYCTNWFDLYVVGKVRPNTFVGYRSYLKVHILPCFGNMYISELTKDTIQHFINERSRLSTKTLLNIIQLLRQILDSIVDDGYLEKNPARKSQIVLPKTEGKKREALTEAEVRDILQDIGSLCESDRLLICLYLFTGMRRGEVLGLKWNDIDLTSGLISIRQTATYPSKNQANVGPPKSKSGKRHLPIITFLADILRNQKQHDGFVIGASYKPLTLQQYKDTMNRIKKAVDLHGATAHVFRHTLLTMASNSGIEPKMLQAIAGHSSMAFTYDRYVHVQNDQLIRSGNKLNDTFGHL